MIRIAIPVKNRAWILPDLLRSIPLLDFPKSELSIHFVDDGSTDSSVQLIKNFARTKAGKSYRSIRCDTFPSNGDNNTSSRNASSRYECYERLAFFRNRLINQAVEDKAAHVLMLDSDTLVKPGLLRRLLDCRVPVVANINFVDCPECGLGVNPFRTHGIINAARLVYDKLEKDNVEKITLGKIMRWERGKLISVDVLGGCVLMDYSAIRTGQFDRHPKGEFIPFCLDLKKSGIAMYVLAEPLSVHVMVPRHLDDARTWVFSNATD